VIIITEGPISRCEDLLHRHNIDIYVWRLMSVNKTAETFRHLKTEITQHKEEIWVVGDQLTRDIAPANEAGLTTIFFPSSFVPLWELDAIAHPDSDQLLQGASIIDM